MAGGDEIRLVRPLLVAGLAGLLALPATAAGDGEAHAAPPPTRTPHPPARIIAPPAGWPDSVLLGSTTTATLGSAASSARGSWSAPVDIPVIAINSQVLRNGKLLMYGYRGPPESIVWDPRSGRVTKVRRASRELFCSGVSQLPNGRLLATGGQGEPPPGWTKPPSDYLGGHRASHSFKPGKRRWRRLARMKRPRWYPTNTVLANGKVLVTSGLNRRENEVALPELYDLRRDRFRPLRQARRKIAIYPRMHLLADGRIAHVGIEQRTRFLEESRFRWKAGPRNTFGWREEGTSVLLEDLRTVLAFGGFRNEKPTATAELLDTGASNPAWGETGSLISSRAHANPVLLPDGKVLAVGGVQRDNYREPVRTAELYDPATGEWSEMAAQRAIRGYHSTAVLLPDGRVLSAGSDSDEPLESSFELFSPPYLFKGPRPRLDVATSRTRYGGSIEASSPDAEAITRLVLIRPAANTHSVNMEQRVVPLKFKRSGNTLTARAPRNGAAAPPGHYMVFALDANGVPSVAEWVRIG